MLGGRGSPVLSVRFRAPSWGADRPPRHHSRWSTRVTALPPAKKTAGRWRRGRRGRACGIPFVRDISVTVLRWFRVAPILRTATVWGGSNPEETNLVGGARDDRRGGRVMFGARRPRRQSVAAAAVLTVVGTIPLTGGLRPLVAHAAGSAYAQAVLADAPAAYWRLGERA